MWSGRGPTRAGAGDWCLLRRVLGVERGAGRWSDVICMSVDVHVVNGRIFFNIRTGVAVVLSPHCGR